MKKIINRWLGANIFSRPEIMSLMAHYNFIWYGAAEDIVGCIKGGQAAGNIVKEFVCMVEGFLYGLERCARSYSDFYILSNVRQQVIFQF